MKRGPFIHGRIPVGICTRHGFLTGFKRGVWILKPDVMQCKEHAAQLGGNGATVHAHFTGDGRAGIVLRSGMGSIFIWPVIPRDIGLLSETSGTLM